MEGKRYIIFGLELVKSEGLFPKVAATPTVICCVRAFHLSEDISTANLFILYRQNRNQEWIEKSRSLNYLESSKIANYLNQIGVPERLPHVKGLIDCTADPFTELSCKINYLDKKFYLDIRSSFGDFGGEDAQKFEEMFDYIFDLVNLENLVGQYSESPSLQFE